MIFVNICYIIMAVGVSKILTFYSWEFALLVNIPQPSINVGLSLGSMGGMCGKFFCSYLIDRFNYNKILSLTFFLTAGCFIVEFMKVYPFSLYEFYLLRIFQGFVAGIIYSTILANLGEFYRDDDYKKLITILTGGLGLAGPFFGFLYIYFSFHTIIYSMFFIPIIGGIAAYFTVRNRPQITGTTRPQKTGNLKKYLLIILREKYLTIFAMSFALSLINSLLILSNINRLFLLYMQIQKIYFPPMLVRFFSVSPLLLGSLSFFLKKTYRNLLYMLISIGVVYGGNLFLENIFLYMIFLTLCYSLHLILIPHVSYLILSRAVENKDYYSYITHAIRSFFSALLAWIFFKNFYFTDLRALSTFCIKVNILTVFFYYLGKYYLNQKKENQHLEK
jgi:MFS family permease